MVVSNKQHLATKVFVIAAQRKSPTVGAANLYLTFKISIPTNGHAGTFQSKAVVGLKEVMKKLFICIVITFFIITCKKGREPDLLQGMFVDKPGKKDTIIFGNGAFNNNFSFKPYNWQNLPLSNTYYFHCESHFKKDSISIRSFLSSSTSYPTAYFKLAPDKNSFVISRFYDRLNADVKEEFIRIK